MLGSAIYGSSSFRSKDVQLFLEISFNDKFFPLHPEFRIFRKNSFSSEVVREIISTAKVISIIFLDCCDQIKETKKNPYRVIFYYKHIFGFLLSNKRKKKKLQDKLIY